VEGLGAKRFDPLLRDLDLPLRATFFPAGFRLNIATNSRDVLEAAAESWGHCVQEFEGAPLEFRVVIQPEGELARQPTFRMQGHLISVVSDAANFAVADCRGLFASFFLSARTAAERALLRWFYMESMAYVLLAQRYLVAIHAACVAQNGSGILLYGASGAGKSTLSFACAQAGWTFLSDDCTWLLIGSEDRLAIGKPHQARFREDAATLFPELEGYVLSARPHGKLSIEVPLNAFPRIRTANRCPIRGLVFLDRSSGGEARLERRPSSEAVDLLLQDMPSYGEEVDPLHEKTLRSLRDVPAFRLYYQSLEEAVRLLAEIPI
jgi:hypothetical protein